VLKVLATDPGSERDFQVFTEQSGNNLLEFENHEGTFGYLIQKN
jgi:TusA-related sulfurtransferase